MRPVYRLVLVACAGCCVALAAASRRNREAGAAPARFPVHLVSPGELPALWVFVRTECPHCRGHLAALERALSSLAPEARTRAAARLHVVGDAAFADPAACRHPRALQRRLGIGTTPLTWWVTSDSNIARAWLGPRGEEAWQRALAFARGEVHQ